MGRGKGGSTSHGKRTPGGIRTSSQMSKVGEIEAKNGVLGDEQNAGTPDTVNVGEVRDLTTKRLERQQGSNPGGVFESANGQKNYVKVYQKTGQAYSEAVANNIYNALGVKASKSTLFDPTAEGKSQAGRGISNQYVEGKTLDEHGVTKEIADKILDGAAADILLANWDAIGLVNDNIVVDEGGEPVRIDNGGSFHYRARGALKPKATQNKITEWDIFSGKKNSPSSSTSTYSDIIRKAGHKDLDAIMPRMKEQVEKINRLADSTNDFEDLLPKLDGVDEKERTDMLEMLRARRDLLNEKVGITEPKEKDTDKQSVGSTKSDVPVVLNDVFVKNAKEHGMAPEAWREHLEALSSQMTSVDESGNFTMNDEQFNSEMGDLVIANMKAQKDSGMRKGASMFLPNKGKTFLLGDTHERYDNVLAIYDKLQANPDTNLDANPDNKIVLNGDVFAMSKEGQENGQVGTPDSLRGEAMLRMLTYLMARHPNQVVMTNGNHEMGVLLALKSRQDPNWKSGRSSGNNFKDLPREKLGVSNIKLLIDIIENNPLVVSIGDKEKGETSRLISHTAGQGGEHSTATEMANENDPIQWREKYYPVYNGWSDLSAKGLQASTSETNSDKRYFGHVDPSTMKRFMGKNAIPIDDRDSPVGEYEGGGVFVDTQTGGNKSGYVEIDLDKNVDTVHRMDEVHQGYTPGKLHEALDAVANMPISKATTRDDKDTRWLKY